MAIVTFSTFLSDPSDDGLRIKKPASFSQPILLLPARPLRRIECAIVSCFNKRVIMCLLVKLDFAADLTLFPEYTIIKINIIRTRADFPIPSPNLWNAIMGRGTPPSCTLSLWWLCGHIVRFTATFMPWPHCKKVRVISTLPGLAQLHPFRSSVYDMLSTA